MAEKKVMVMIPQGVAVYPHLLEEDKYQLKEHGKREFNTRIKLEPVTNEDHAAFIEKVNTLAAEAFEAGKEELTAKVADPSIKGKAKAAAKAALEELTLHTPYEPEYDDEGEETGAVIVSTKCLAGGTLKNGPKKGQDWSKELPLYDAAGQPIKNRKSLSLWGGSSIIVEAQVVPFCAEGLKLAGVSLRLNAVQVIEAVGGDGGSAASHGFGVVEGGYKTDNFANATDHSEDEDSSEADDSEDDDF